MLKNNKTFSWLKKISLIHAQDFLFNTIERYRFQMQWIKCERGLDHENRKERNQYYIRAAKRLGIEFIEYENQILELRYNGKKMFVSAWDTEDDTRSVDMLTADKLIAGRILRDNGVSTPYGNAFTLDSYAEALTFFKNFDTAVVKPRRAECGNGVTVGVKTEKEFRSAFLDALIYDPEVLVEEFIEGENIRLLTYGECVIAAERRIPAFVVGDGRSNIFQLIKKTNDERLAGKTQIKLRPIYISLDLKNYLKSQKLSLKSVPIDKQKVQVRAACNYSQGGIIEDVSRIIHPEYEKFVIHATKIFNAKFAGVDVITRDITKPPKEAKAFINEINLRRDFVTENTVLNKQGADPVETILKEYFNIDDSISILGAS